MKIETTYTVGKVKHTTCWHNLEICCDDGSTIIVPMSIEDKQSLADSLLNRIRTEKTRELESLKSDMEALEAKENES